MVANIDDVGRVRIFGAPRQYIQGPGALSELGAVAARCRAEPLLITDADVLSLLGDAIIESFDRPPAVITCSGQITSLSIDTLTAQARSFLSETESALVFGIGGGTALDAAKGVALRLGAEFVSVPTIASNDSAAGRAIAIYGEDRRLERIEHIPSSPEAVIVDTAVIVRAPPRFLRAGIGDAISKKFEAERANRDGAVNFFGTPPMASALILADACYRVLRRCGAEAMCAASDHTVTPEFENVVEACLFMSGIAWESGGISLAHAVVRGIARSPGADASLHGEHVAYGLLVMHALEGRPDEDLLELMEFYRTIGQATTLSGLGLGSDDEASLARIAAWAFDSPNNQNLIVSTTQRDICTALARVEALARAV